LVINTNQAMPNGGIITIRTKNTEIEDKSDLPLSRGRYITVYSEIEKGTVFNIYLPASLKDAKEIEGEYCMAVI